MLVELMRKMYDLRMKEELLERKMYYFWLVEMLSRKKISYSMWCQYL